MGRHPRRAAPDQLIDQAIKRAVDKQLAQKGLTKVEKNADLYVGYQAAITQEKSVNLWGTGNGLAGGGEVELRMRKENSSATMPAFARLLKRRVGKLEKGFL